MKEYIIEILNENLTAQRVYDKNKNLHFVKGFKIVKGDLIIVFKRIIDNSSLSGQEYEMKLSDFVRKFDMNEKHEILIAGMLFMWCGGKVEQ